MKSIRLKIIALILLPVAAWGQSGAQFKPLLDAAKKSHTDDLVVIEDGKKVVEYHVDTPTTKRNTMSITKSIMSLAIANLLAADKIDSVDTPVTQFYPEWRQGQKKDITIRHLMNHTSGLQNVRNAAAEIHPSPNIVQLALCASVVDAPGTKMKYNNKAVNILPDIIKSVSEKPVDEYLQQKLFDEMGIINISWKTDEAGNQFGMSGLRMSANDLAKIGELMLQHGSWQGRQLIPKERIEQLLNGSSAHLNEGLLWWRVVESKYIIDEDKIQSLKEADIKQSWIKFFENMKGTYDKRSEIVQAMMNHSTRKEFMALRKTMKSKEMNPWKVATNGEVIGYNANGDYGQYLYIYPKQNIVAVRMVSPTKGLSRKEVLFNNFGNMVYKLATDS